MIKCKINNVEHEITDGFILKDKYTEELDSAMMTIPFSDKLDLSPFDFVEIEDDRFGKKYFLIDTWAEDVVSFSPLKYNYNISLISETIKLQKVVMPNLSITQRIDSYKRDIWDVLEKYNNLYVYPQYPELLFDNTFRPFTYKVECPETLFNRPTAYEVYNTLLAKKNAVVKIHNHQIGYIKLDEYGKEIEQSKLYYVTDTQSIEDYANRLDSQVSNGISNIDNVYTISGLSVRGGDGDAVLSDDNMSVVLEKPIYDFNTIHGVYIKVPVKYEDGSVEYREFNITTNIVEKSVYDTYLVSNDEGVVTDKVDDYGNVVGKYKRNALYYVRGSNIIQGLSYSEKLLITNSSVAIYNILQGIVDRYSSQPTLRKFSLNFKEADVKDNITFRVQYKTSESYRISVEKTNKYNATLIDNQTETQIDSNNFGKVEQDKLNRLGNKSKIITATYYKDEIIPELGDYIDEYVLAEREIVYYDDYALFKGYLYKDYVRKNMFYGLNSKKRSTQIETESVIRNDIINFDLSFETEKQQGYNAYGELKRYVLLPLMLSHSEYVRDNFFVGDYNEFPKYAFIRTTGSDTDENLQEGGYIVLTPSTYSSGKSNIIHFEFKDNFSAGIRLTDRVTVENGLFGTVGGRKQEYVKYVDNYGQFRRINIIFFTNKPNDSNLVTKEMSDNLPLLTYIDANTISNNANGILSISSLELWKDNRETTAISVNLNYKDSDNVIIGSFAENTGVAFHDIIRNNIGICYSLYYEYEIGDTYGLGNVVDDESVVIDSSGGDVWIQSQNNLIVLPDGITANDFDYLYLSYGDKDVSKWKSWGIVDKETGSLILGVNKGNKSVVPTQIYLKCVKKPY